MAKVMIVDDEGFMRMILKRILSENGHEVINEAFDGEDSIRKYQQSAPELVLMDIILPEMEGITALERIMEFDPAAKVVMCSCLGQESMIKEAIRIGAKDFIVKPFTTEKVLEVIDKVI